MAVSPRKPVPGRVQTSIYLSGAGLKAVRRLALDLDMKTNDVIAAALNDYLKKHGIEIDTSPPKLADADT